MSLSGNERRENIVRTLWEIEFKHVNDHFASEKKSLEDLLREEEPSVRSIGGGRVYFKREDLEFLANLLPKKFHARLKLPFTIVRQAGWRRGVYMVKGDKLEVFVVHKLVGTMEKEFGEYHRADVKPYIYKAQLLELIRKVPSLVSMGFFLEDESSW